jgi:MoxR-like ATPase
MLRGNSSASPDEVRAVALPVLRHRVIANYNATGEGITTDEIIKKLITTI